MEPTTKTNFTFLREGMSFSTFTEYNRLFEKYKRQHTLRYVVKSTKFFANDKRYIGKSFNPDCVYSEYNMRCKAVVYDKDKKVEIDLQCPSEIKLVPRNENQTLLLKLFNESHNHPVTTVDSDEDKFARIEIIEALFKELSPALIGMDDEKFGQSLKILKRIIDPSSLDESETFDENLTAAVAILNERGSASSSLRDDSDETANNRLRDDSNKTANSSLRNDSDQTVNGSERHNDMEDKSKFLHLLEESDSDENESVNNSSDNVSKRLGAGVGGNTKKKQCNNKSIGKKTELGARGEAGDKTLKMTTKRKNASPKNRNPSDQPPQKTKKATLNGKECQNSPLLNQQKFGNNKKSNNPKSSLPTDSESNNRITRTGKNNQLRNDATISDQTPSSAHYNTRRSKDSFTDDLLQIHFKKQIVFETLTYAEKLRTMLTWVGAPERAIDNSLAKEYIVTEKDIRKINKNFKVTTLFNGIVSKDLKLLEKYVTDEVYQIITASVVINEKILQCKKCSTSVSQVGKIACGICLMCYHMKCVGIKKLPKNYWRCSECK